MDRTRMDRMVRLAVHGRYYRGGEISHLLKRAPRERLVAPIAATAGGGRAPVLFMPEPPEPRQVDFEYFDPKARSVSVVGSFNHWNPKANPLQNVGAGAWSLQIPLEPGRYEYRFLVDGKWRIDPAARHQVTDLCGGVNSVVAVE